MNIRYSDFYCMKRAFINAVILFLMMAYVPAASADNIFLPPNYVFSTNYYNSFGAPDIYASVLGDSEFERGETASIMINLVNKGILYGFKYDTSVGDNKLLHAISLKELEYESMRTTALGITADLVSDSPYITIESAEEVQTLESLRPGELPERPLIFTINISNEAPAGIYYLQLPVSYQYQSQVRMATNEVIRLGLSGFDHIAYYTNANRTLAVPVQIKASPNFVVENVSGRLMAGEKRMIQVTYKNTGEIASNDSIAKMVVMYPLKVDKPVVRLGTMMPGESKTASFEIFSEADAVVKTYGIDSEIKYFNEKGGTSFSNNLKIEVLLDPAEHKIGLYTISIAGVIILLIYIIVNIIRNVE